MFVLSGGNRKHVEGLTVIAGEPTHSGLVPLTAEQCRSAAVLGNRGASVLLLVRFMNRQAR